MTTPDTAAPEPGSGTTDTPPPAAPAAKPDGPVKLPDDHPLVKAFNSTKAELVDARSKLQGFEDANKSDIEKLTEQVNALKTEASTSKGEAARLRAAMEHGLSIDDLELLGDGNPEQIAERAAKLAERLGSQGKPAPVKAVGKSTKEAGGTAAAFASTLESLFSG